MRTLYEIISSTRDGEHPDYEELRYAVCALEALMTFDGHAFSKLVEAEQRGQKPSFVWSAEWQFNERFERIKRAMNKDPKEWVGWNNDPDNPEFLKRRKASIKLFNKVLNNAK